MNPMSLKAVTGGGAAARKRTPWCIVVGQRQGLASPESPPSPGGRISGRENPSFFAFPQGS